MLFEYLAVFKSYRNRKLKMFNLESLTRLWRRCKVERIQMIFTLSGVHSAIPLDGEPQTMTHPTSVLVVSIKPVGPVLVRRAVSCSVDHHDVNAGDARL
jgi:hypothetical protein